MANQDTGSGSGGGGDGPAATIPDEQWGNWGRFIADDGRSIKWGPLVNWFARGGIYTTFLILVSWFSGLAGWFQEKFNQLAQGLRGGLDAIRSGESLIPSAFDEAIAWMFNSDDAPSEAAALRGALDSGSGFASAFDSLAASFPSGALGFVTGLTITLLTFWALYKIGDVIGVS